MDANETVVPPGSPSGPPSPQAGPLRTFGDYEVVRELGRGGQGVVYEAYHGQLERRVALKVLLDRERRSVLRFQQEAKVLSRLLHPNLVRVLDIGQTAGQPFMALEFVAGRDLEQIVRERGVQPFARTAQALAAVARAVQHCHDQGIVHRDLKPANVMLEEGSARPVLADLGLLKRDAQRFGELAHDGQTRLSNTGETKGTPAYMPPEQADPTRDVPVGPRSDVYSLGATLYFCLTGQPPYQGSAPYNVIVKVLSEPPPDPRALDPSVPRPLAELCRRCMAKDPRQRPASASELADALEALSRSLAPDSAPAFRPVTSRELRLALPVLGVVGVLAIVVGRVSTPTFPSGQPDSPRHLERGLGRYALGDYPAAIAAFDRALELDPALTDAYRNRARARDKLRDPAGVLADLEQVVRFDPCADSYWARGKARARLGDHPAAIADFERALELDPTHASAYNSRGIAKWSLDDPAGAEADYTLSIQSAPTEANTYLNRAVVRRAQGNREGALADVQTARELGIRSSRRARVHVILGNVHLDVGDWSAAVAEYSLAIELDPGYALAYEARAAARGRLGDAEGREQDERRAAELEAK